MTGEELQKLGKSTLQKGCPMCGFLLMCHQSIKYELFLP